MDGKQPCPPNTKLKKESILLPELGTHFIVRRKPSKTQRITLLSYTIYLGILCPYWLQCMVLIISVLTVLLYYFTLENKRQQSLYPRELHIKLQVSSTQVKPFVQAPSLKELEASETALRIPAQVGR